MSPRGFCVYSASGGRRLRVCVCRGCQGVSVFFEAVYDCDSCMYTCSSSGLCCALRVCDCSTCLFASAFLRKCIATHDVSVSWRGNCMHNECAGQCVADVTLEVLSRILFFSFTGYRSNPPAVRHSFQAQQPARRNKSDPAQFPVACLSLQLNRHSRGPRRRRRVCCPFACPPPSLSYPPYLMLPFAMQ